MMHKPDAQTIKDIRSRLRYEPETGLLYWIITRGSRAQAGSVAGGMISIGYIYVLVGKHYAAHRIAWLLMTGEWPKADIDHRNKNRADNRWVNLREATRSQNLANQGPRPNNTSGLKGVSWDAKNNKWVAQISKDGKARKIGRFQSKDEASAAYCAKAKELFGEFASS